MMMHLVVSVEGELEVQVQGGVAREVDAVGVEDQARDRLPRQFRGLSGELCDEVNGFGFTFMLFLKSFH